jgi:hypothetical protein
MSGSLHWNAVGFLFLKSCHIFSAPSRFVSGNFDSLHLERIRYAWNTQPSLQRQGVTQEWGSLRSSVNKTWLSIDKYYRTHVFIPNHTGSLRKSNFMVSFQRMWSILCVILICAAWPRMIDQCFRITSVHCKDGLYCFILFSSHKRSNEFPKSDLEATSMGDWDDSILALKESVEIEKSEETSPQPFPTPVYYVCLMQPDGTLQIWVQSMENLP